MVKEEVQRARMEINQEKREARRAQREINRKEREARREINQEKREAQRAQREINQKEREARREINQEKREARRAQREINQKEREARREINQEKREARRAQREINQEKREAQREINQEKREGRKEINKKIRCSVNYHRNALFTQTFQFGPHIVFDCQWEGILQHWEVQDIGQQFGHLRNIPGYQKWKKLLMVGNLHLVKKEDFIFPYFCNFKMGGRFEQAIKKDLEKMECIITESSYLDIFSRKNLVYLSSDSPNIYTYNPNDVCVIGGLVDTTTTENLSIAYAKEHGIRHARLPLKHYFR